MMNKINRTFSTLETPDPLSLLARVKYVVLAMLLICATATFATIMTASQSITMQSDPFAAYDAVFPGQHISVLDALAFSCPQLHNEDEPVMAQCISQPQTGPFSQISVLISDETIRRMTFEPVEDTLDVANLIDWWGEPEIYEYTRSVNLRWPEQNIVAWASDDAEGYSPSLSVWRVYFIDPA